MTPHRYSAEALLSSVSKDLAEQAHLTQLHLDEAIQSIGDQIAGETPDITGLVRFLFMFEDAILSGARAICVREGVQLQGKRLYDPETPKEVEMPMHGMVIWARAGTIRDNPDPEHCKLPFHQLATRSLSMVNTCAKAAKASGEAVRFHIVGPIKTTRQAHGENRDVILIECQWPISVYRTERVSGGG